MSYNTWHEYGYGICVDDIGEVSVERLQALIHMAPAFEKKIIASFAEDEITTPTAADYYEFIQDCDEGLSKILQSVIQEIEGLELTYCNDFDGKDYLLFTPSYPWSMPENEKGMTEERLAALYKKYISVLTDAPIEMELQSVGNGG